MLPMMVPVTVILPRAGPGLHHRRGGPPGSAWLALAAFAVAVALIAGRRVAQPH
jgi:hypothetical protein